MVAHQRMDLTQLITHEYSLDDLPAAFELFSRQGGGVLKVAVYPTSAVPERTSRDESAGVHV